MHKWTQDLADDLSISQNTLKFELIKYRESINDEFLRESYPNRTTIERWFNNVSKTWISLESHGYVMSFICAKYDNTQTRFSQAFSDRISTKTKNSNLHIEKTIIIEKNRRRNYWKKRIITELEPNLSGLFIMVRSNHIEEIQYDPIYICKPEKSLPYAKVYWKRYSHKIEGDLFVGKDTSSIIFNSSSTDWVYNPVTITLLTKNIQSENTTSGFCVGGNHDKTFIYSSPVFLLKQDHCDIPKTRSDIFLYLNTIRFEEKDKNIEDFIRRNMRDMNRETYLKKL